MKKLLYTLLAFSLIISSCENEDKGNNAQNEKVVNVYSQRHYDTDDSLFNRFTQRTGIKVNVLNAKADELINRIDIEGANSPADILITVDAERMIRAKEKGLLQEIKLDSLKDRLRPQLIDVDNMWIAMSYRARVIAYNKAVVDTSLLSTYASLTDVNWKNKILIRSSENAYNQALLSSIIANKGYDEAKKWAEGIVKNMARDPKGNDRDQVKAMVAGVGDLAIINTYYLALMHHSANENERSVAQKAGVFFPDQQGKGSHVNISAIGLIKSSRNKENAELLIEYLLSDEAQAYITNSNYEYPSVNTVEPASFVKSWGEFKADFDALGQLEKHHEEAIKIFHEVGWK